MLNFAPFYPGLIPLTGMSPEGADKYGENRLRTFEPDRVRISSLFRAKAYFRLTQGKPWAVLSCPFGAAPSGQEFRSPLRRGFLEIDRIFRLIRSDILVNAEEVVRIVFPLDGHQLIVIIPVGRSDPINAFFHHKIHVGAA
jgi:hypothetical protein